MNVNPESSTVPDPEAPAETSDAAAKPVRRRRAVKVVEEAAAAPVAEVATEATETAEEAPKPKRRKAAPKVLEAGAEDAVSAEPVASAAEPAPDLVIRTADDGERPVPEPTPVQVETRASEPEVASADVAPVPDTEGSVAQDDGPRGRRRGRRDRNRGEPRDPQAPGEAGPAVEPVQAGALFAQVLSGEFDAAGEAPVEVIEEETEEAGAPKRVLQPEPEAPKLHKVLAQSGIGSRRDMEALIEAGEVTVNDEVAHVGQRVSFGDRVKVKGKQVRLRIMPLPPRIIAYHKPVGEIVTNDDPQNRPTVFRRLPRLQQGKWQSVGRLDINTEGLLLFTNSGELANQLMHPRFGVEREYAVRVLGTLTAEDKARLLEGVDVEGQKASFRSIEEGGGDGANHWYRVVITEGRNREVRKLFDTVSLTVSRLIRIRYGTVVLPFGLKRGVWVDLEDGDVRAIRRLASGGAGQGPRENGDRGDERGANGPQGQRNDRQGGRQNNNNRRDNPRDGGPRDNPRNAPRGRNPDNQPPAPSMQANADERVRDFDRDDDADFDIDPASIPNPLEQTFDKRFAPNPRSPVGGRGFGRGGGGFGAGGSAPAPSNKKGQTGPKQPDPLQTSLGFIGADAFHRKGNRGGGGGGGGGGGRGGNRGGGGGGGGGYGGGGGGNSGGFGGGGGGRRGR
ncbi:MAG: pseudouridine synthase [Burkholderiaceae bacterium]